MTQETCRSYWQSMYTCSLDSVASSVEIVSVALSETNEAARTATSVAALSLPSSSAAARVAPNGRRRIDRCAREPREPDDEKGSRPGRYSIAGEGVHIVTSPFVYTVAWFGPQSRSADAVSIRP